MALVRNGVLVSDEWQDISGESSSSVPPEGPVLVSLEQWQARRGELSGRRLGLRLRSDQHPAQVAADLGHFELVALEFPRFRDGRAYTYARLLRERHGYAGELRAVGDVLLEQLHYMQRCGFNAFEIDSPDALRDWQVAAADHSVWYQATGDGRLPARLLRSQGPG
jgi:uncharacterized protein (DUF934 family)